MAAESNIEVSDLYLVVKPKVVVVDDGKSMLESMYSSMSSSMQLAQDCLEQEQRTLNAQQQQQAAAMKGLDTFAMTIDNRKLVLVWWL